jgi:two-component system sensor histidine kinase FlrB
MATKGEEPRPAGRGGARARGGSPARQLDAGFEAFIAAAQRLEASYAELRARAAAIDHELADANRKLQATLCEREELLAALPVGVVALDADGRVAWRNREAVRLCGEDDAAAAALAGAPAGETECRGAAVRLRRAPLPGGGRLLLLEDRSQVVRLEREVTRLDRLAGLSELALGVAHEIKNPLNGVMGFAALLERAEDLAAVRRFAALVREGLERVDGIVEGLLGFARPRGAQDSASVEHAVSEAAAAAGVPRARVAVHGDGGAPVDAEALARVLAVLFRNSLEASGSGVRIAVRVSPCGANDLEVVVRDDGPGVPAELAGRVFEPFVSGKARGSGLGLALAARVLDYLGGGIRLLNPGEPGAAFAVRLPRAGDAGAATASAREDVR